MFDQVLNNLPAFATFFLAAIVFLAAFLGIYAVVTPYNELELIRAGNVAASVSLAGALIGIALPLAVAVAVSHNIYTMVGWGLLACLIQLLAFVVARLALPHLTEDIPQGKLATGIFLASVSIGVGIINAGCLI